MCLQSTQWPLSGLHSALKLSGSVFTAWSACKFWGVFRETIWLTTAATSELFRVQYLFQFSQSE